MASTTSGDVLPTGGRIFTSIPDVFFIPEFVSFLICSFSLWYSWRFLFPRAPFRYWSCFLRPHHCSIKASQFQITNNPFCIAALPQCLISEANPEQSDHKPRGGVERFGFCLKMTQASDDLTGFYWHCWHFWLSAEFILRVSSREQIISSGRHTVDMTTRKQHLRHVLTTKSKISRKKLTLLFHSVRYSPEFFLRVCTL